MRGLSMPDPTLKYLEDHIDNPKFNVRDTDPVEFKVDGMVKSIQVVKWCRLNLGTRGDGWDFDIAKRGCTVRIWSSKLVTMWVLKW